MLTSMPRLRLPLNRWFAVGMGFPGGKTLGDAQHVTLRFDDSFMKMAADGAL